jgi:dinuclear metal center YbgI/SA1388 family protein
MSPVARRREEKAGEGAREPGVPLMTIVDHLDALLQTRETPDYGNAVNGLQLENAGLVRKVAAAVDFSTRSVEGAVDAGANLLLVHHGMFWPGVQAVRGPAYRRLRRLLLHDVAVYASHLPLDRHPRFGNGVLLARELGLEPSAEFGRFKHIMVGVRGETDVASADLVERANRFAMQQGGRAVSTPLPSGRRTRKWAVVTGAGASRETLDEALETGIDTLIVGEGPHWSAVDAEEAELAIIYAGHYATETVGVRALAEHLAETFGIGWTFVEAPTGL